MRISMSNLIIDSILIGFFQYYIGSSRLIFFLISFYLEKSPYDGASQK